MGAYDKYLDRQVQKRPSFGGDKLEIYALKAHEEPRIVDDFPRGNKTIWITRYYLTRPNHEVEDGIYPFESPLSSYSRAWDKVREL